MDQKEKAELFDMWDCVHRLDSVYDFDTTMSAEELKDSLSEIINLELFEKINK